MIVVASPASRRCEEPEEGSVQRGGGGGGGGGGARRHPRAVIAALDLCSQTVGHEVRMDNARRAWELPAMRTGLAAVALVAAMFNADQAAQRLEQVRSSPTLADDPAAIDALARELPAFPAGPARVEATMFVAAAWLGRMHRPDDGIGLLRTVVADPEADPLTARLAERELLDALTDADRLDEAVAEAASHANRLDPRVVQHTRTLVRRRTLRRVALGELVAFGALAGVSLVRAYSRGALGDAGRALRRIGPTAIGFAAYVAVAGGVLASRYETGNAAPFLLLGVVVLVLVAAARAWSAVGSRRAIARAGRAVVCAVGMFAAAFVLLDALDPTYLDGFGL
jgi:hypothetical protein